MDRKWWTLIAVCVGTFMLLLDVTIVNVALPAIQTGLKASFSDLQWVVDAYALMLAALLLTTGSLADLWGRRLIFVIGLVLFSASSLASGLAQSPLWLNLARGAQGIGGAAMFSTGLALLASSFHGRERGMAFGIWGATTGLAVAIGPVIGGGLTTGISWRWIFLVNVPIGVAAVLICLTQVEESRPPHARRPDLIGAVTFSGALGALVYALIKGDTRGWTSAPVLGCLIGAGVLLLAFLIAERVQGERAMFDLNLFRKPTFSGGLLAAFALSGGLFALFLYLTLYLQDVLGYSALQTGYRFLVLSGGILLTSTLAGRLTAHVPIRFLIAPGLAMVAGGLLLMRGITSTSGWTHLIPGFIVAGAGVGLINPPLASTAIGVVRPERAGMASGINSTFRQVGISTGIAGLGAIFSHTVRTHIVSLLSNSSALSSAQSHALAASVAQGAGPRSELAALPAAGRGAAVYALHASFASGLNDVFLVGAILTGVSAVLTLVLIRTRDFEAGAARGGGVATAAAPRAEATYTPAATQDEAAEPPVGVAPPPELELRPVHPPEPEQPPRSAREAAISGQNGHDMHMSAEGPPSARDVRLVEAAVRAAEESALAYAREIGEARRHLAQAIEHLDRAEQARAELNRHAGDFTGSGGLPAREPRPEPRPEPGPAREPHREPAPDRVPEPEVRRSPAPAAVSSPAPGIAVAGQTPASPRPAPPPLRPPGWAPGGPPPR